LNNTIKEEESSTLEELEDNGMKVVEANKDEWLNVAEPVLKNQFQRANWQPSLQEVRSI
jgi:TRAP-type C4-dicarboxylate transport system substrate-binding protein